MSPELEARLRFYGWFPGRRVDDAQVALWLRAAIQERGCRLFPEAVRILREFGGLALTHLDIQFGINENSGYSLPLSTEQIHEEHSLWLKWEWELDEILFPIGYELSQDNPFVVSATGKIFYLGSSIRYYGGSIEEFLKGARGGIIDPDVNLIKEAERIYRAVYDFKQF